MCVSGILEVLVCIYNDLLRASLVVQWLGVHLPVQGAQTQPLSRKEVSGWLGPMARTCALKQSSAAGGAAASGNRRPHAAQLEKAHT